MLIPAAAPRSWVRERLRRSQRLARRGAAALTAAGPGGWVGTAPCRRQAASTTHPALPEYSAELVRQLPSPVLAERCFSSDKAVGTYLQSGKPFRPGSQVEICLVGERSRRVVDSEQVDRVASEIMSHHGCDFEVNVTAN